MMGVYDRKVRFNVVSVQNLHSESLLRPGYSLDYICAVVGYNVEEERSERVGSTSIKMMSGLAYQRLTISAANFNTQHNC
jgi:hypothetical protein